MDKHTEFLGGPSIGIGVAVGLALIAGFLQYQHRRYQVLVPGAVTSRGRSPGPDATG